MNTITAPAVWLNSGPASDHARAAAGARRNAELHSAGSQICNLRTVRQIEAPSDFQRPAECNSAIQQIENLRYAAPLWERERVSAGPAAGVVETKGRTPFRHAVVLLLLFCAVLAARAADYAQLKAQAEQFIADGSFAKAQELYQQAQALKLPPADSRWVDFRLADTQWRSAAATQRADNTKLEQARQALEKMVRDVAREEEKDRAWVEVQESLGDYWWTRRNQQHWGQAWQYYQPALDWWAGARDLELARARYLKIVFRVARPPQVERYYYYGYYGNVLPLPILENALKIARTPDDQAHLHYLVAMTVRNQGGSVEQRQRVPEEFEAAVKAGRKTDWYDDALYNYGEWMASQGRFVPMENGGYRQEPDYVKALELFRRLVKEFTKGETRYFDQAQNQIKGITQAVVGAQVSNIFLPDSEIQYSLNWRNVPRLELALYPVNLAADVRLDDASERRRDWLNSIDLAGREKVKSWTHDTKDKGDHKPGSAQLRLDGKLKPGAYVLEATGGGKSARDLVLVTDAALVLKASGRQALVYFCNALSGAPLAGGKARLWQRYYEGNQWHWREAEKATDKDGLAVFDLADLAGNVELYAGAVLKDRQAFSLGNSYQQRSEREQWRIYAFTDRPAYRPKETVNWKLIARRYNGSVYSTPANQVVEFEIHDPRGTKVKEDKVSLNEFGTAWRALDLTESMPLGEYRVQFWDQGRKHHIGQASLFRLEEYKLPEFKVAVKTPEETGPDKVARKKAFRLGETVEVTIQADYYFGGPVANANVEVIVYQNPFYNYWRQPREFAWFYDDIDPDPYRWRRHGGRGQIMKRETLKTDATGKATLTFDTPQDAGQDFEYQIEARVTDASRREITGNGTARVTRQRYYVHPRAPHNLHRPQDKVTVEFKALDANGNPMPVEGMVTVTRDYWYEIWITPDGREVKGDELKRLQAQAKIWPPPPARPDQRDWRLKFRGYEHEEILKRATKTDAEGKAEFTFTPEREGYYRVSWLSQDAVPRRLPQPIRAETTVWVANNASSEIGYRHGGVEIIADKDTFRVGNEAPVMLVANSADRYVLFSIEGEDLYSYRLVHLTGTVKLIDVLIEEKHVPNIFLSAAMVSDRQFHLDTKQIVVPPTRNFLTVEVKPGREQYQPREEGTLVVTTRNDAGQPVSAEVALGLVDESVYYIQGDYAGDPRKFYFGTKRSPQIQTQSTFNQKSYAKLVEWIEGEQKRLIDERQAEQQRLYKRQLGKEEAGSLNESRRKDVLGESLAMDASQPMATAPSFAGASRGLMAAKAAAAMPASAPVMLGAEFKQADKLEREAQSAGPGEPAVQVRSDFRSTVLWQPDVKTDQNGRATVKVKYPDSLTGWKATARAVSKVNQFGIAEASTRTKQPLIVRLQAPRFFVVGDEVVLSAVVNNNTAQPLDVKVTLDSVAQASLPASSGSILLPADARQDASKPAAWKAALLSVPANGEARVDWKATVKAAGEMKLKATARGGPYADAMEKTYAAYEHGIEKFITKAGKVRGKEITVKLDIPKERKPESTSLIVQVTPSLAVTMLDALPYLIHYPYGCTEQTMSRFLPSVITAKTLKDLGLQPEDVMSRVFGGIDPKAASAAPGLQKKNDLAELDKMVKAGLDRLYDFQHGDGGWGWWKQGESDHWMTAYVVWGLTLARNAGTEIKANVLDRGASYLDKALVEEEESPDMQAFMLHALAEFNAAKRAPITKFQTTAFNNLWTKRADLNAYTRALFALAAHRLGKADQAKTLIENLENGVKRDNRPDQSVLVDPSTINSQLSTSQIGTAHWGEDGVYWRWSDGGVEATAFALRALLTVDPKNKLIEPVTHWLIKNRRGAQWSNTRDTAIVVLAMNDYLRVSGELKPEVEYEVLVNGKSIAKKEVSGADVFNTPSRFTIDPKLIRDGDNKIQIKVGRVSPSAPSAGAKRRVEDNAPHPAIYFAAEATFFSLEEPIPPAGNEIFVKREYYKLVGRPTLLKGYVYDQAPLKDGDSIKSGERLETVITIEAKNNYEYLVFEDLKPAGIEAVEIRSGESLYAREMKESGVERKFGKVSVVRSPLSVAAAGKDGRPKAMKAARGIAAAKPVGIRPMPAPVADQDFTGRSRWVYQELRDRKVALFLDKLPEGVWEIHYSFRAEVPGRFHALPVLGHAMYVPEIRCNGAEVRITVEDAKH